jgi:hypothetical protein
VLIEEVVGYDDKLVTCTLTEDLDHDETNIIYLFKPEYPLTCGLRVVRPTNHTREGGESGTLEPVWEVVDD